MPDRVISYDFRANFGQFSAGLAAMGKSVEATGAKLTALDKNGVKMRSGLTQIGGTAGKIGLVFAAGVGAAIAAAANFEQSIADVAAATHETAGNMALLRQAALDAGQATKYSATEAAGAIEELAKAGVSTKDILAGGLTGALNLAAAGGLEVADAAEIAASALVQFKLSGDQVPHVADLLAAGAGKAQGSVQDLGYALKYAGVPAASLGVSIEETTGTLAEFASAGIVGEQAGTTLRSLLLSLAAPTQKASITMDEYGISLYDAQGKFVGIQSAAEQLHTQLGGLSEAQRNAALNTIFGTNAIQGAIQLYNGGGAAIKDWTAKVNDQGYAAKTAAIKMDTLKGDLEQLSGAFETALIGAGGGGQGPLRSLVQGATEAVNAFNKLPSATQSTVTALGGIVAITGGGLFFGSKVVTGIADTKEALENLGAAGTKTAGILGAAAKAAGIAAAAFAGLAIIDKLQVGDKAFPGVQELTGSLLQLAQAGSNASLPKQFDDIGHSIERLSDPNIAQGFQDNVSGIIGFGGGSELRDAKGQIEGLDAALTNLVATGGAGAANKAFSSLTDAAGLSKDQIKDLMGLLPGYKDALAGSANQAVLAASATDGLADSQSASAAAAQDQASAIADAVKAMQDETNAALDAFDAETQYRQAVKDATAEAKKSQAGIKGNSDEALKNRDSLSALASAWNSQSSAVKNNNAQFKAARSNFIQTAEAMGVPKKAAEQLADSILQIPQSRVTKLYVDGADAAIGKAQTLKSILDALHSKDINIALHYQTIGNKPRAPIPGSADGGTVDGPRQPYGDKMLYLLAPGEEVISNRHGQADQFRSDRASGRIPGYADGGTVGRYASLSGTLGGSDIAAGRAAAYFADQTNKAGDETKKAGGNLKSLKDHLEDLKKKLDKVSKSADNAQSALDDLKSQRDSLRSSVSSSLTHDPFQGGLSDFSAQVGADKADSDGMLTALQALVQNGLDPKGALFQQLAASGNVSLAQQFAALTRGSLADYAAQFNAQQGSNTGVTNFAGNAAFGDAIKAQTKVVGNLDASVKHFTQAVNKLENQIDKLDKKVEKGAHDGTKAGQQERNTKTNQRRRTGGR